MSLFLGIDFGTSGCRASAIDNDGVEVAWARVALAPPMRDGTGVEQDARIWWQGLVQLCTELRAHIDLNSVTALAVDGTSGTLVLCDVDGNPLAPALMYNDARATVQATRIAERATDDSGAHGAGSALAKLLWLREHRPTTGAAHALHQADWILGRLSGRFGISDENNALKLGYDPLARTWPAWLKQLDFPLEWLPEVHPPGAAIGAITPQAAAALGFAAGTRIVTGTTDSTAACLATGIHQPGDAVTSLGSTMVMKVLTAQPVFAAKTGVYSHRLGDLWLAGGASNSGGAVLLNYFTPAQMEQMTPALQPQVPTGLDYYPLSAPGERFPVNDPELAPRLTPRPDNATTFFQALLEGMAGIEALGYQCLAAQGAPRPTRVYTVGGGAANIGWTAIRQRVLKVPVYAAKRQEAAYGSALLARQGALSLAQ